jgi:hypothetical protein
MSGDIKFEGTQEEWDALVKRNKQTMAQQTAVEWLVYRIKNQHLYDFVPLNELEEQAKQMEKEQIMNAVYDSMGTNFDPNMGRAELYYNETYNK